MRRNVAGQAVRFSLFRLGTRIENPTIVAGDARVDLDGAGQVNVNAVPTSDAAGLVGFYGTAPVNQRTKAAHGNWAALANVVQALVELGLFDAA